MHYAPGLGLMTKNSATGVIVVHDQGAVRRRLFFELCREPFLN